MTVKNRSEANFRTLLNYQLDLFQFLTFDCYSEFVQIEEKFAV